MYKRIRQFFTPLKTIAAVYIALILVGALFLCMPFANTSGRFLSFTDSAFMSASAVTLTGLEAVAVPAQFNVFGKIILLLLVQTGGLGFMSLTTVIFLAIGKNLSLRSRILLKESISKNDLSDLAKITKRIVVFVFSAEVVGAALLMIRFIPIFGAEGVFISIFHSVSAFCNSGLYIFSGGFLHTAVQKDVLINIVTMVLVIAGGLGYFVFADISLKIKTKKKLELNTKIILIGSLVLIISGALFYAVFEWQNGGTIGASGAADKFFISLFSSVYARSAGFSAVNINMLNGHTKLLLSFLSFIGAAPGSTGGGLKITTVVLLLFAFKSGFKGEEQVVVSGKTLPVRQVYKAFAVLLYFIGGILFAAFLIAAVENGRFTIFDILFETVNAICNSGMTTGITLNLGIFSKYVIILLMYAGKAGLLIFSVHLTSKTAAMQYPETRISIG